MTEMAQFAKPMGGDTVVENSMDGYLESFNKYVSVAEVVSEYYPSGLRSLRDLTSLNFDFGLAGGRNGDHGRHATAHDRSVGLLGRPRERLECHHGCSLVHQSLHRDRNAVSVQPHCEHAKCHSCVAGLVVACTLLHLSRHPLRCRQAVRFILALGTWELGLKQNDELHREGVPRRE